MFGINPMLLPLETLPGWPTAPDPSLVEALVLLAGIPLGIGVVFMVAVMGPHWMRRDKSADSQAG
ncbi:MAG: hypothetical protein WAS07_12715 [Micropruina sp.]|nr:hypothetical protein [Micropruina sp.]